MRSKTAKEVARRRADRLAAMTAADRVALAERLGREGVASYMTTHGVARATAMRQIKAAHQRGRRPSASAQTDEH